MPEYERKENFMKLNSECIRGLLLSIEEICDFDTLWEYQQDDFESEFLAE